MGPLPEYVGFAAGFVGLPLDLPLGSWFLF